MIFYELFFLTTNETVTKKFGFFVHIPLEIPSLSVPERIFGSPNNVFI